MYYVYLIRSLKNVHKTYVGHTDNMKLRLEKHNSGGSPHTAKYTPWELVTFVAVNDKEKAINLEKYFKSGSGHAFAKKHLW